MVDLIREKLPEIQALCREHGVLRLDLFGSARGGNFDPNRSDIDLLVDFAPVDTGALNQYMGLHRQLEELLGRKVDLIERQAVRNPYFILAVRDDRERLYAA